MSNPLDEYPHTQALIAGDETWAIVDEDCLSFMRKLPDGCIHTCITSPPYWGLRDYGADGQLGLESTPEEYVDRMVEVFREVRRILRDDGTLWLNLGDSYVAARGGPRVQTGQCANRTEAAQRVRERPREREIHAR